MGGSSKGSGTTTQTNKQELPPWLDAAAQESMSRGFAVAQRPYDEYQGDRVAAFSGDQTAAQDAVRGMQGQTASALGGLGSRASEIGNYTPQTVTAGSLPQTDLSGYMNPYLQNVEQTSLAALEQQRQQASQATGDAFQKAGAYGGSRQAVAQGVLDAQSARAAGEMSAQLRSQGYQQAAQLAETDIGRAFTAAQSNQQAGLNGAQMRLAGLNAAGNLAAAGQQANLTDINALSQSGLQQQQQVQQGLAADWQRWSDSWQYPIEQQKIMQSALSSTPYGSTANVVSNAPVTRANPAMGALGGALSGAASGAMLGSVVPGIGTGVGAVAGAAIGGAGGYFGSR